MVRKEIPLLGKNLHTNRRMVQHRKGDDVQVVATVKEDSWDFLKRIRSFVCGPLVATSTCESFSSLQ
jgi:hypothetical protein